MERESHDALHDVFSECYPEFGALEKNHRLVKLYERVKELCENDN